MPERLDLYFRAHTVPVKQQEERRTAWSATRPQFALIFHCATTSDEKQDLLFGAYICAQLIDEKWTAKEIGLFGQNDHPEEFRILQRFVKGSNFELATVDEFRRKVFLKYLKSGGLIVAYDAPSQISRIAVKSNKSRKKRRAFSFYFRVFKDKKTGKIRPSGYEPGLSIESLDASKAIFRLIKYKFHEQDAEREEEQEGSNVHILDLKTLTAALTGEAYTFESACEIFGAPASRSRKPHSRVTKPAIETLLRNVTAALELLNRLSEEFDRHGLNVAPERCYSPATLAKAYYLAMGMQPPEKKFNIPEQIQAIAMQAACAGRAECRIRRVPLPVLYIDFHAQFPAVSSLLASAEILRCEWLEFAEFTDGARDLVERAGLRDCFRPQFWKRLCWYALVEPQKDVVPLRAKFGQREDTDPTLAWNFLSSKQPFWLSGPDVIAAKLMTGKPMKILEAIKINPHDLQQGLVPVQLYSKTTVDPHRDDLAVKLVELRESLKKENSKLAGGLKVAANSAAFGILCQMDVTDLDPSSRLHVFSGNTDYLSPPERVWERPAEFYSPLIASLVTGGSHLLCAMLERAVHDMGGHIAAMDTDSGMIVSSKDGGLIPCAGGPHKAKNYELPGGNAAIRALSWAEVDGLRKRFEPLNPWRDTLGVPFLKLEKENFGAEGERLQLYAYCISTKLYCLFNLEGKTLLIRKPSGHGLGFLQAPYSIDDWQRRKGTKWKENLSPWIFEAWHFILSREFGLPHQPPRWLKQPAVMAVPVTTPQALERLGCFKDVLRPFTVVMVPFPQKEENLLWTGFFIIPYMRKLNDLHGRPMVNINSGATFYIYDKESSTLRKSVGWLALSRMKDEIDHILSRAESKFCTPNGGPCTSKTVGLLVRRHIVAGEFHYIGREASTRWGSGPDLSMMYESGALDPVEKTFREYERVVDPRYLDDIRAATKQFSTKLLSRKSCVAECAIRNFKNGKNTIKPRTLRKLTKAIRDLENKSITNSVSPSCLSA